MTDSPQVAPTTEEARLLAALRAAGVSALPTSPAEEDAAAEAILRAVEHILADFDERLAVMNRRIDKVLETLGA